METTIYIMIFLVSFGISLLGAYNKGNKNEQKRMLDVLHNKNVITSDTYVKLLKTLDE